MNDLSSILSKFIPISLEEMIHVRLLDRVDTKYVFHEDQLAGYLEDITSNYNLLVVKGKFFQPYENLYFDTPDFHLYMIHQNGKKSRYKLRFRKYLNSGDSFFEIKLKTNTDRTIKSRTQVNDITEILNESLQLFIQEHLPGEHPHYFPALRVSFDRMTFVNKESNERLTIDMNLRYNSHGAEKKIQKIVIVEVKQKKNTVSPFRQLMKIRRQKIFFISKYCLGIINMNDGIKKNRFKEKLHRLKKIGYEIIEKQT